jgi:uncharacterized membrane protein YkoI
MPSVLMFIVWWGLLGAAHAQGAALPLQDCVPPRQLQEFVAMNGIISPAAAVITARRQVPNSDVVRANLCRSDNVLVYVIVALRKDGRVVQVMIDGPSGQVKSVH